MSGLAISNRTVGVTMSEASKLFRRVVGGEKESEIAVEAAPSEIIEQSQPEEVEQEAEEQVDDLYDEENQVE
jgi:hypothetical protein